MTGIGVRLERVSLDLGGRRVLDRIDFDLPPGGRLLLLGANGAGKSQLLKLLAGERWPTPTGGERRHYRDRGGRELELTELLPRIGYVGAERQDKYLRYDWNFSVQRVVATGCHGGDRPIVALTAPERRRVRGALARLSLWALRNRRFLSLSYGERRRVLLARALAGRPRLLLLDEPFNGLDAVSRRLIGRELARLSRTQLTLVLATHRAIDAPRGWRRCVVLRDGRIVYDGTPGGAARRWLSERASTAPVASRGRRSRATRRADAEPLVELRAVSLYRDYRLVIRDLDWAIGPHEHWAIVGANGSGKSTLLALLYGALQPALGGEIRRRDHPPGSHIEAWRRRIGLVSPELQAEYLQRVSVLDLVVSGLRASVGLDLPPSEAEAARARAALGRVGLDVDAARSAQTLSYGQLRLALIARALVLEPEALLLDEPLTGLDAHLRRELRRLFSGLAAEGVQLIVAAHHPTDLVPEIRHVLALAGGRARKRRRGATSRR